MTLGDLIGIGLFAVFMLGMVLYVWSRAREEGRYARKYYNPNIHPNRLFQKPKRFCACGCGVLDED